MRQFLLQSSLLVCTWQGVGRAGQPYLVQAALGLQGRVQLLLLLHPHLYHLVQELLFGFFCVQATVQGLPEVLQLSLQPAAVGVGVCGHLVGAVHGGRGLHPRGAHVLGRAGGGEGWGGERG